MSPKKFHSLLLIFLISYYLTLLLCENLMLHSVPYVMVFSCILTCNLESSILNCLLDQVIVLSKPTLGREASDNIKESIYLISLRYIVGMSYQEFVAYQVIFLVSYYSNQKLLYEILMVLSVSCVMVSPCTSTCSSRFKLWVEMILIPWVPNRRASIFARVQREPSKLSMKLQH